MKTKKQIDAFIRSLRKHPEYQGMGDGRKKRRIPDREFPREQDVFHQFTIEMQAPDGVTTNEDGDMSSKFVTDWYVRKYCTLNHLKGA